MSVLSQRRARRDLILVGLVAVRGGRLLLVRKRGLDYFVLPGGKHEPQEDDSRALSREINEELGCAVESLHYLGAFRGRAAWREDVDVVVRAYSGALVGWPIPHREIDELIWYSPRVDAGSFKLAPSVGDGIVPHLFRQ